MMLPLILLGAVLPTWALDLTAPRIHVLARAPRWEKVLRTEVAYLVANTPAGEIPNELEHAIRPLTATALSAAVCLRFNACEDSPQVRDTAVRIITDVTRAHLTGGGKTATGKAWGHQWQSALWAWQGAFAAWLLADRLPPAVRQSVIAMMVDEADRFLDIPAPYAEFLDTKAEENAWNSLILVLASETLRDHPHRARWRTRALEYMISSFATRADRTSTEVMDGRPLRDWVRGANIHSDYTLENHGFVHPDYMSTISLNLMNEVTYQLAGSPLPQACRFHAREVYENLKWLTLPDGGVLYPNGTDWNLHRIDMTASLHTQVERSLGDADAGVLARQGLATLEKMQARNPDGRTFLPGEYPSYPTHESHAAWMYASALMAAQLWPEPPKSHSPEEVTRRYRGGRIFEDARFFVVRTPQSISSFSWGLRVMGMTVPLTPDLMINPMPHSLVGLFGGFEGSREKPGRLGVGSQLLEAALAADPVALSTVIPGEEEGAFHVTLTTRHGRADHIFSFTALPSGKSVYLERWTRPAAREVLGGLVSLVEEPRWVYGSTHRDIQTDGGKWAEVDGRLGYAVSGGGGIRLIPDVRNTLLALNAPPSNSSDTAIVTLPGATLADTQRFAASAWRLALNHPDVSAALVDGFIIATNFSPHPMTVFAKVGQRTIPIPISGRSTRLIPE